jgi:hypothetical protein
VQKGHQQPLLTSAAAAAAGFAEVQVPVGSKLMEPDMTHLEVGIREAVLLVEVVDMLHKPGHQDMLADLCSRMAELLPL